MPTGQGVGKFCSSIDKQRASFITELTSRGLSPALDPQNLLKLSFVYMQMVTNMQMNSFNNLQEMSHTELHKTYVNTATGGVTAAQAGHPCSSFCLASVAKKSSDHMATDPGLG